MKRLTGEKLETMSAAPFSFPIGDIKTDGHRASD